MHNSTVRQLTAHTSRVLRRSCWVNYIANRVWVRLGDAPAAIQDLLAVARTQVRMFNAQYISGSRSVMIQAQYCEMGAYNDGVAT